jgi:hypothetical protein
MNETASQGVVLYKQGDEAGASRLFIDALQQNWQDAETWRWLAAALKQPAAAWRCLRFAAHHDPFHEITQKALAHMSPDLPRRSEAPSEHEVPVEVYVAGTRYTAQRARLHTLRLGERLWLRREPHNRYDANAIWVEAEDERVAGYLPRDLAAGLAPAFDAEPQLVPARVIQLAGYYPHYRMLTLKVAFSVPEAWLPGAQPEPLEYIFDDSGTHAYVFLDCAERLLERVVAALEAHGLGVIQTGISTRPAADGRFYPWYIRLNSGDKETLAEEVEQCFEYDFGVVPAAIKLQRTEARIGELEAGLHDALRDRDRLAEEGYKYLEESDSRALALQEKENEVESLRYQLEQAQDDLLDQRWSAGQAAMPPPRVDIGQILSVLLPDVEFLRNSLDAIVSGAVKRNAALRLLQQLRYQPESVQAKAVESVPGFREQTFGRGRLYYRRDSGGRIQVLVSDKNAQAGDLRFLRSVG